MKTENGYQTAHDLCRLLLTIKNNPGLKQVDLVNLLNLDKAKVSRLCNVGIQNGFIYKAKEGRGLYKGPAFENKIQL